VVTGVIAVSDFTCSLCFKSTLVRPELVRRGLTATDSVVGSVENTVEVNVFDEVGFAF
jgi:hypothetical protein